MSEIASWLRGVAAELGGDGCRDWPWATNAKGYGVVRWQGRQRKVGHVVLELAGRPRPAGAHQLHTCDRPSCAAPWHLRWGSPADNAADQVSRERTAHGVKNGNAKLTEADVRRIRYGHEMVTVLAAELGVHRSVVGKVRRGLTWRHI